MFLPRCLKLAPSSTAKNVSASISTVGSAETEQDEPIKVKCVEQRHAGPGEPKCAVCGRYGEYICDETEDDVCSMECKKVVLMYRELSFSSSSMDKVGKLIFIDGKPVLPEWEPDEAVTSLSSEHVAALRKSIAVSVNGDFLPPPVVEFGMCGLPTKLQENMLNAGYEIPTPIQMQAIPAALKGRDILVSSQTGSGKTLAFLLPIILKCYRIRSGPFSDGMQPLAMVLTPTRELCIQVEEQAKILGKGLPFKTALVVGGDVMPQQLYRLRKGVELIVATPGRLLDLLSKHDINISDVCMLVLDEVDCMLERGFRDQVMQIVRALSTPQVMLFSATVPPAIESFSKSITKRLLTLRAGQQPSAPCKAVEQTVLWVETKQKKNRLFGILQSEVHSRQPAVVFVNSRMGADLLSDAITTVTGLSCASLHGQKPMKDRRDIMKSFMLGEVQVVVATGVLGRGLDLFNVTLVIIFDMPNTIQEYTHQVGRASRLDEPGSAFVFINNEDKAIFRELVQLLRPQGVFLPKAILNSSHAANKKKRKFNNG